MNTSLAEIHESRLGRERDSTSLGSLWAVAEPGEDRRL
jgi:hypothetical protein